MASLLRIEEQGFGNVPYAFRYLSPDSGKYQEIEYMQLDDEFLGFVVHAAVSSEDFPDAYELYLDLRKAFKPVGNRKVFRLSSKQKTFLFQMLRQRNPRSIKRPYFAHRGENVFAHEEQALPVIESVELEAFLQGVGLDINDFSVGFRRIDGKVALSLYSRNDYLRKMIDWEVGTDPGKDVFLVYVEISIDQDGQPIITALQPQINVPQTEELVVREYVEHAVPALLMILKNQIHDLFPERSDVTQLRMTTAGFELTNQRIAQRTAWKFYADLPVRGGYHIEATVDPHADRKLFFAKQVRRSDIKADSSQRGGIDLGMGGGLESPVDQGILFQLDPAMLQQTINAQGFIPIIEGIREEKNLPGFLGIELVH